MTARQLKEEKDLKERLLQAEKNKKKDEGKRRKIVVKEKIRLIRFASVIYVTYAWYL